MTILGINTESDGFGASVVRDGRVLSSVEQFKIRRHWSSMDNAPLPADAIKTSLDAAGIRIPEVDLITFIGNVESAETTIPHIRLLDLNSKARIEPVDHRVAHATAAFYSSPFERAAILVLGYGHPTGSFIATGNGRHIDIEKASRPLLQTLCALYDRTSCALGFHPWTCNKLAWLGAGGEAEYLDVFRDLMPPDKTPFRIDEVLKAVDLNRPQNVAASLQTWTNEVVVRLAEDVCRQYGVSNICLAGHLAENPFLVRELEEHFRTECVFVPPAPGRESLSIGAALACSSREKRLPEDDRFPYPALGPEFSDSQIKEELDNCKLVCSFFPCVDELAETACKMLSQGGLVGWFQGRCEFGHRALGFRSILANPFTPFIDENVNRFLKHRETFHPFVLAVPEECAPEYFDNVGANARTIASLYAVRAAKRNVLSRFVIGNGNIRVHTVSSGDNHLLWTLLSKMRPLTGHPLLINTSFNLPSEPLVLTPRDAIRSFYASGLDALAIGHFLLTK